MLIPPRRIRQWATIGGTETTFASVAPVVAQRGPFESGCAEVVMAYPTSVVTDPRREGVRLDFRWVVQCLYTSFWASDPAEAADIGAAATTFALSVLDDSPMVGQFAAGYSDPEAWEPVFGDRPPEEVIRHFHISFDDYGRYDLLAVDCVVRQFPLSPTQRPWDATTSPAEQAAEEADRAALLLADAMALAPLPPISRFPLHEDPPGRVQE